MSETTKKRQWRFVTIGSSNHIGWEGLGIHDPIAYLNALEDAAEALALVGNGLFDRRKVDAALARLRELGRPAPE